MNTHPDFINHCPAALRASFMFEVSGTKRSGVIYVTADTDGDAMAAAAKAAKVAAKRSGDAAPVLRMIVQPRA